MSEPDPVITINNQSLPSALLLGSVKSFPIPLFWSGWMDEWMRGSGGFLQVLFFPMPTYQQNLQICNGSFLLSD